MKDKIIRVGRYDSRLNDILNLSFQAISIYRSKGLQAHIIKQKHFKALDYIELIPNMLKQPDYVGSTVKDGVIKLEYIKCYKDNIVLCVKVNPDGKSMYVATMYEIPQKKIDRFLHSGRIKRIDGNSSV